MSELLDLAQALLTQTLLAHGQALALGIGAIIALGVVIIIVLLLLPRKPPYDHAADQRMADLHARIQTTGELLARAQSQLQQTVHERLDAVTQNLGQSMQTSTKNTTDHLQQLHARLFETLFQDRQPLVQRHARLEQVAKLLGEDKQLSVRNP